MIAYPPIISSVFLVPAESGRTSADVFAINPENIVWDLRASFAATLQPVLVRIKNLGDFQLDWPLWTMLAVAGVASFRRKSLLLGSLWLQLLILLLLLIPTPLLLPLWRLVPGFVLGPTGDWPSFRLYPICTALVVFAAALAARHLPRSSVRTWYWILGLGLGWTTVEAYKFVEIGHYDFTMGAGDHSPIDPENEALSRYSYALFMKDPAAMPYYSHGVVDPLMEERLFADDGTTPLGLEFPGGAWRR